MPLDTQLIQQAREAHRARKRTAATLYKQSGNIAMPARVDALKQACMTNAHESGMAGCEQFAIEAKESLTGAVFAPIVS